MCFGRKWHQIKKQNARKPANSRPCGDASQMPKSSASLNRQVSCLLDFGACLLSSLTGMKCLTGMLISESVLNLLSRCNLFSAKPWQSSDTPTKFQTLWCQNGVCLVGFLFFFGSHFWPKTRILIIFHQNGFKMISKTRIIARNDILDPIQFWWVP